MLTQTWRTARWRAALDVRRRGWDLRSCRGGSHPGQRRHRRVARINAQRRGWPQSERHKSVHEPEAEVVIALLHADLGLGTKRYDGPIHEAHSRGTVPGNQRVSRQDRP